MEPSTPAQQEETVTRLGKLLRSYLWVNMLRTVFISALILTYWSGAAHNWPLLGVCVIVALVSGFCLIWRYRRIRREERELMEFDVEAQKETADKTQDQAFTGQGFRLGGHAREDSAGYAESTERLVKGGVGKGGVQMTTKAATPSGPQPKVLITLDSAPFKATIILSSSMVGSEAVVICKPSQTTADTIKAALPHLPVSADDSSVDPDNCMMIAAGSGQVLDPGIQLGEAGLFTPCRLYLVVGPS